jgi:hypothetical protein
MSDLLRRPVDADAPADFLAPDPAAHAYPRPQLVRDGWTSLNGEWQFVLDPECRWRRPEDVAWDGTSIRVPFAPETPASGVGDTSFYQACWYRRAFGAPALRPGERLLLHFGAVDYCATVWVNRMRVGDHEGGYLPFTLDVTDALLGEGPADGLLQELVVLAEDDPHDLSKPRGKQDWQRDPHSIWYPRTSGIWQTVWLEVVPPTHVAWLRWTPSLERWEIGLDLYVDGDRRPGMRVQVKLSVNGTVIADDTYALVAGEVHRRIALSDPGIDDYRNELLWSPERPTLIDAEIKLWAGRGDCLDAVRSYTALRQVGTQGDRFLLNGRPYTLRLVLDQGYWAHTGLTRRATPRSGATWSSPRPWASTACASTRRSRTRATSTGPTASACSCGARCRAPTGSPPARSSASRASGPRRSGATSATPAWWPGCPSTRAGASPTCRPSRSSATGCRRSTTSPARSTPRAR